MWHVSVPYVWEKKTSLAGDASGHKMATPTAPAHDQTETQVVPPESVEKAAAELRKILPESNPHGRNGGDAWEEILEEEKANDSDKVLYMLKNICYPKWCNFLLSAF